MTATKTKRVTVEEMRQHIAEVCRHHDIVVTHGYEITGNHTGRKPDSCPLDGRGKAIRDMPKMLAQKERFTPASQVFGRDDRAQCGDVGLQSLWLDGGMPL